MRPLDPRAAELTGALARIAEVRARKAQADEAAARQALAAREAQRHAVAAAHDHGEGAVLGEGQGAPAAWLHVVGAARVRRARVLAALDGALRREQAAVDGLAATRQAAAQRHLAAVRVAAYVRAERDTARQAGEDRALGDLTLTHRVAAQRAAAADAEAGVPGLPGTGDPASPAGPRPAAGERSAQPVETIDAPPLARRLL